MTKPADALRHSQIAFQSDIVAKATHEFQNHLAVVKEYSGLIRDLLHTSKPDKHTLKRCAEISQSMEERAQEASALVDVLNRFAHRGDFPLMTFRVNDVVADLVTLLSRTAAQHKLSLQADLGNALEETYNDPFLLQYLLFSLASPLIETLGEDGKIIFSTSAAAGKARIRLAGVPGGAESLPEETKATGLLDVCTAELSATLSSGTAPEGGQEFVVLLPSLYQHTNSSR